MRIEPFFRALPVYDWLFRESLYLTNVGWERVLPRSSYPRPNLPIYFFDWSEGRILPESCLAWCFEGGGELETGEGNQRIQSGSAFYYPAGMWHRHRPHPDTGWSICWLHCNGTLPHEWQQNEAFVLNGRLPVIADGKLFQAQFKRLVSTVHEHPGINGIHFSYQVMGLFSHFIIDPRSGKNDLHGRSSSSIERARDFIMNHSHDAIGVADVAAHVGCHRRTLEMHFRKIAGCSILDEIQRCRADRARALLIETDLPVKHVLHLSGFQSHEQMRLVFQRLFGCSPVEVRNQQEKESHHVLS